MRQTLLKLTTSLFTASILLQPALASAETGTFIAPQAHGAELQYLSTNPAVTLSHQQIIALVRAKVKYVFVIYQENRSFDSYFGTYPGADGIYSQAPAQTPGYYQPIINTDGTATTVTPFLIGPAQYAWDTDDLDHSHARLAAKIDVQGGVPQMDKFAETEELKYSATGNPSQQAKGYGELAMAHEDCDTIPFLWGYADKFVLFDHVFQDMTGPSTPGNLTIFAAQSGQTQYALHPDESFNNTTRYGSTGNGAPVLNDNNPVWGSASDPNGTPNVPRNPTDSGAQINQTYASLAITLAGDNLKSITAQDQDPTPTSETADLADIQDDIPFVTKDGLSPISWGWYEEGFDKESTDPVNPAEANGSHASYVTHHNGPQYFGYVSNNPAERANLHGIGDFFTAISSNALPASGGVFYLKGGYENTMGLTVDNPLAKAQTNFLGDDDHPAYSDAQISEAMVAKEVNAIAQSKYWPNAAIIITWDDSEGDYDHVPPPVALNDQNGLAESYGPRVPMIVISPYAKVHEIASEQDSQASVVKFVDEVFGLPPLATLPDEAKGFKLGQQNDGQSQLGPQDNNPAFGDLMTAFDVGRLRGTSPMLPASYVTIPTTTIMSLPHYNGAGCQAVGLTPTNVTNGIQNVIPADFNPLPGTNPST